MNNIGKTLMRELLKDEMNQNLLNSYVCLRYRLRAGSLYFNQGGTAGSLVPT